MKSHETAISRSKPSQTCKWVMTDLEKPSSVLDYGCGKGSDVAFLREAGFDAFGYDPYFQPEMPEGPFNAAMCSYVLNVVQEKERSEILEALSEMASIVYIAVRNGHDFKQSWEPFADGFITGKGTFQAGLNSNYMRDIMAPLFDVTHIHTKGGNTFIKGVRKE